MPRTKLHDYGLMASSIMQLSETHDRAILLSASQSMQQLLEKFTIVEELQDPEIFQRASQSNFSITEQLETIVQRVQTHSPQRNFEVRLDGLKHAHVMGFVGVIDFVLAAVIQNADRHGDPQGPVIIRATSHAGSIRVIVQNQLTDLNDIDVSKLFQPFSRLGSTLEFNQEGAGMSLYIARMIMQRLGGKITLVVRGKKTMCCEIEIPLRYSDAIHPLR
jgi:signal transduction histidine kinase